ncbi:MAG: AsnC family transcriptional regulator [Desulfotomaculaceae bacterium]|nr:AsnC family transcriptional regulator [Desulfotomaculaceae bacterium]
MDQTDRALLNLIQADFPLVKEPYRKIGELLDLKEADVIARLKRLHESGVLRRLGGVFDYRKLGYTGTLCAIHVEPAKIGEVAAYINTFPGVTHNYLREHYYNIWFTVLAENRNKLDEILELIRKNTGIGEIMELPAERVFKIKVNLQLE